MSYPRVKNSHIGHQSNTGSNLKNLLLNKFRGKFANYKGVSQDVIEKLIKSNVDQFMRTQKMTEVNLIKLDKVITD